MIELLFILVACAIAYRIAFPASKAPAFVPLTQAAAPVVPAAPVAPSVPADTSCILATRKRLAADEKLTPELKAAFDAIQAALEVK